MCHLARVRCAESCYSGSMKQIITAKLKLQADAHQFAALRRTQLAYRDALNSVSKYNFTHGKLSSGRILQHACYDLVRQRYHLPAQLACNVPRQVGVMYAGLWTKVRANAVARQAGRTTKRYKGLDQAPTFISPTLTYNYRRDYSLKTQRRVSIMTLDGRVVLSYTGYDRHIALLQRGALIGAAKLWYDKPRRLFYLLVSLEVTVTDPLPDTHQRAVGVDVGQRYLAVTTDTTNHIAFYGGKQVRAKADHYARLRKRLQRKGTRSATRRLSAVSGRERRHKRACNHIISRRIVDRYPHSLIGLENLTHIRERTIRGRAKRASEKQRRANRHASRWAFAELQGDIAYKALLAGSIAVQVDAYHTSQMCPHCGYTSPANRPGKGLLFVCRECRHMLHADLVGARNVALRTLLVWHDWSRTGVLSLRPDVSGDEAKAARRQRYAELRWSPDTNPCPQAWGN